MAGTVSSKCACGNCAQWGVENGCGLAERASVSCSAAPRPRVTVRAALPVSAASEASERACLELLCAVPVVLRGAAAPLRVALRSRRGVLPCAVLNARALAHSSRPSIATLA